MDFHLGNKSTLSSIVISNGVDVNKIKNANSIDLSQVYDGYISSHKVVCMVGRFAPEKNQETLIRSINELSDNYHLLLIGEGDLKEESILLVNSLSLTNRVSFLGLRMDVPEILKSCSIGVLSSNWEGMPITALEIFASNIPFLGSDVPGIRDLFSKEENVMLFENNNAKELAYKIDSLVSNVKLSENNLEISNRISSKYTIEVMTKSYLELYKNILCVV